MLLWLCGFWLLFPTIISGPGAKALVARLEARYRSSRTLEATFLERYTENGRQVRAEAGTVYFRRPGKMRWEYDSPERNLFLVDGKTAWFYVPADRTATRVPAKESADWRTPLALLAGEMKVSRVCDQVELVEQPAPEFSANAMLHCALRGAEKFSLGHSRSGPVEPAETAYFEVVRSSGDLSRVLVVSPGGVTIEFRFANWLTDPSIDDSFFRFRVPPGVAIVNGELPAEQNPVKR